MNRFLKSFLCLVLCLFSQKAVSTKSIKVKSGTELNFKITQDINYKETPAGHSFRAKMSMDVIDDDGDILIEEGTTLIGKVKMAEKKELLLEIVKVKINKHYYKIETHPINIELNGSGKAVVKGAAVGSLMGAAFGGRNNRRGGAKTGALVGAGLSGIRAASAKLSLKKGQELMTVLTENFVIKPKKKSSAH